MPSPSSPLPRKKRNTKKGISRQQNFKPAIKAMNSLVLDLENSENLEDDGITSQIYDQKSPFASPNITSANSRSTRQERTASRDFSPDSFFRRNGLLKEFDGDSESEDDEDNLVEERRETRVLTEVERLEEAQTALEGKIKETKELLQRRDRTRIQRLQGQQKLARLEAKLEMLDQRVEAERAGKNRWTFVKRVVRKPKVGFHSSELLNRKVSLRALAASFDTKPRLADVEVPETERKSKDVQLDDNPPPKHKKIFKTKALQEFHTSLREQSQNERKVAESSINDVGIESSINEWCRSDSAKVLKESGAKEGHDSDRKEIDKGWLRISDRPKGFVKKIDIPETRQTKEAWININEKGQQMFARKVFRAHINGTDPLLSRSLKGRAKSTLGIRGEKLNIDNKSASKSSSENGFSDKNDKEKGKEGGRVERISSSHSQRPQVKLESIGGTTSFLPPIPKSEAKKRPKQEQAEKLTDEHDEEQKKERMILIPNRKRVARRRVQTYLKQLDFVKAHGLDQKEVLKKVGTAIQEHNDGEEEPNEHQPKLHSRSTLYLIGALSRHHLRPPTAP